MKRWTLFILLVVITPSVMADEVLYVAQSGGDYTSLDAAFADVYDPTREIICDDSFEDTTPVYIDPACFSPQPYWPSNTVWIHTSDAYRHSTGGWDTSAYRLKVQNEDAISIGADVDYVWVDGLQIWVSAVNGNADDCFAHANITGSSLIRVSNCIIRGASDSTYWQRGFVAYDGDAKWAIWNNVFFDFGNNFNNASQRCVDTALTTSGLIYNCVFYGSPTYGAGVRVANNAVIVKNCVFVNFPAGLELENTPQTGSSHNASQNETIGTDRINISGYAASQLFEWGDATNYNFRTLDGGMLEDAGANITGISEVVSITFDFEKNARSASGNYELGWDELGVTPTPTPTATNTPTAGPTQAGHPMFRPILMRTPQPITLVDPMPTPNIYAQVNHEE